jgi:hypothetical protein
LSWNGWPLQRVVVLLVGLAFLVIFVQVTLFHYRQNFRHWSMWIPVLATPVFGLMALVMALFNAGWLRLPLALLLAVGIVAGIFGTVMHVRGVGQRVEGYVLRNFMIGPPLGLPAMVSALSILGLFGLYWR